MVEMVNTSKRNCVGKRVAIAALSTCTAVAVFAGCGKKSALESATVDTPYGNISAQSLADVGKNETAVLQSLDLDSVKDAEIREKVQNYADGVLAESEMDGITETYGNAENYLEQLLLEAKRAEVKENISNSEQANVDESDIPTYAEIEGAGVNHNYVILVVFDDDSLSDSVQQNMSEMSNDEIREYVEGDDRLSLVYGVNNTTYCYVTDRGTLYPTFEEMEDGEVRGHLSYGDNQYACMKRLAKNTIFADDEYGMETLKEVKCGDLYNQYIAKESESLNTK